MGAVRHRILSCRKWVVNFGDILNFGLTLIIYYLTWDHVFNIILLY